MKRTQRLSASDPASIRFAADIIRAGGLVAFPTETVYGLGCNALNHDAVARVFEAKQRPRFDPLIVHLADRSMLEAIVESMPPTAYRLMDVFWPGPLTLVLPKRAHVPDLVTAGLPTVAVRMPAHPAAQALIREAGVPIAAPSANPFGYVSPTCAQHVVDGLGDRVDVILDGGGIHHCRNDRYLAGTSSAGKRHAFRDPERHRTGNVHTGYAEHSRTRPTPPPLRNPHSDDYSGGSRNQTRGA